jgi:Flp pilus assembly protein TadB
MPLLIGALAMMFTTLRWQAILGVAAGASLVVTLPSVAFPVAAASGLVAAVRRWRRKRRLADRLVTDVTTLCDLVVIALTGGLGLRASLMLGAACVGGDLEHEVAGVLRRARVDGMSTAMAEATGAGRRLYRVLARAAATGSELVEPVRRIADEMNAEQATKRLETVRRVPVLMLFPLTTLILPGFLLLAIAPAIIDALTRLDL